jgi:hypothetical protein
VHPCGRPSPWVQGVGGVHRVGQVGFFQAATGAATDFADLFVVPGVVGAGTDEPATVVVINRDFIGLCDEPAEDLVSFAKLIAVVGRHAGWCGGAFRRRGGLGGDLVTGRWAPLATDKVTGDGRVPVSAQAQASAARPWSSVCSLPCRRTSCKTEMAATPFTKAAGLATSAAQCQTRQAVMPDPA